MSDNIFKTIEKKDVIIQQKVATEKMFGFASVIHKPFNAGASYELVTSSIPVDNTNLYTPVTWVQEDTTDLVYFSYARAISSSYSAQTGSNSFYYSFNNELGFTDNYNVNNGTFEVVVTSYDVIAISREFYKDGINLNSFCMAIHTGSSATANTTITTYNLTNGILGLYPDSTTKSTPVGDATYLYPISSSLASTVIYNATTDTVTYPSQNELNKTKPYGEVYLDLGVVVLFKDLIKLDYPLLSDSQLINYTALLGGVSEVQLNGMVINSRLFINEFNYSNNRTFFDTSNPTVIRESMRNNPTTFITGVGLYNSNNELIAFARPSRPIKKNFDSEISLKLELYY
jgi:hypothetical protein